MSILSRISELGRCLAVSGLRSDGPFGPRPAPQAAGEVENGFGLGFGPASGLGTVLVLASLALASGPARADGFRVEGEIHVDDLLIRGGYEEIAPVPRHGVEVELWSDPDPGEFVRVGESVQLRFRTNEDCYVTLISIDGEGRARRLFPRRGDDGWVRAGRVQALPGRWDDFDLRFTGPVGEEYVFAIASRDPLVRYYPAWLSAGWGPSWNDCDYRYGRSDLYDTGWCVGDPIPEIYRFTERLVPFPGRYATYAATWIRFDVGRRHAPVWRVCNECGGLIGNGHDCGHGYFEIHVGIGRGVCDFYRPRPAPRYRHVVCRTVEPIRWNRVFREPVGRWRSPGDVDGPRSSPDRSRDGKVDKRVMTPDEYRWMREEKTREGVVRSRERSGAQGGEPRQDRIVDAGRTEDSRREDRARVAERKVEGDRSRESSSPGKSSDPRSAVQKSSDSKSSDSKSSDSKSSDGAQRSQRSRR